MCTEADLTYGGYCPMGNFCAEGSSSATECGAATFLPHRGAELQTECQTCPQGKYCGTTGLGFPTGDCDAGYFCAAG